MLAPWNRRQPPAFKLITLQDIAPRCGAHLRNAKPRYIAIEGPIRAGKSSLAALLAQHLGAERIAEPEDNPFLDHFYRGEQGAAFAAQMWFLQARQQQMAALTSPPQSQSIVADYLFEKDKLFACLNLSDAELLTYNRAYQATVRPAIQPDLVVYLQASPRTLKARMRRKGLRMERRIADSYVEQVARAYEHFFFHYTASDLLVVNTDELDFVQNPYDLQLLLRRLQEPVRGTQYFLPLSRQAMRA